MVVFTCNHCGESLRKQGIEKHYSFVCRNVKSVTCVDCFKDFREEEYVAHIKCLTEEERYAAKGSMPNGVVKKGELKQESWVDMIKSILEDAKLTPPQRDLLATISSYNNIPRKKPKFLNFIRSSSGGRVNMKVVEDIWNIIESYKINKGKQQQDSNKRKSSEDVLNDDNDTHKQKKKKEEHNELKKNLMDDSNNINNTDVHQSKKKKKHQGLENEFQDGKCKTEEIEMNGKDESKNIDDTNNTEVHQSKKKKKKNKHQDREIDSVESQKVEDDIENNVIDDSNKISDISNIDVHQSKKKKMKNKHKDQDIVSVESQKGEEEIENNAIDDSNKISNISNIDVLQSKKKKKKNNHKEHEIDSEETQKGKNNTIEEIPTEDLKQTEKFDFKAQIIRILERKTTISLNKLQKKAINAYLEHTAEVEPNPKIIKQFNKSLKKVSNVDIVDDYVSLKPN